MAYGKAVLDVRKGNWLVELSFDEEAYLKVGGVNTKVYRYRISN